MKSTFIGIGLLAVAVKANECNSDITIAFDTSKSIDDATLGLEKDLVKGILTKVGDSVTDLFGFDTMPRPVDEAELDTKEFGRTEHTDFSRLFKSMDSDMKDVILITDGQSSGKPKVNKKMNRKACKKISGDDSVGKVHCVHVGTNHLDDLIFGCACDTIVDATGNVTGVVDAVANNVCPEDPPINVDEYCTVMQTKKQCKAVRVDPDTRLPDESGAKWCHWKRGKCSVRHRFKN